MKKVFKGIVLFVICLNTLLVCLNIVLVFVNKNGTNDVPPITAQYLTPHIKLGHIEDAQKLARVHYAKFLHVLSFSGYLTVDEKTDSHMFFWYFPTENLEQNSPLILWLNGGPGWSSLYGMFAEIGPFYVISPTELGLRKQSWHKQYNLLFIDNPVGTGFSRTRNGHATNETNVGRDLYITMKQFYRLFPNLINNDFYIAGQSYAAKYIYAMGNEIYINNKKAKQKINLQGLMIGNGFTDPINQLNYADYLYQLGLIDLQEADVFRDAQNKCVDLIEKQDYLEAYKIFSDIIFNDLEFTPHGTLYANFTGLQPYNYFRENEFDLDKILIEQFLNERDVKQALHVDDEDYLLVNSVVSKAMRSDVLQSVKPWVVKLLSQYRILMFAGQLDVIVAYPNIHNFVMNLNYSGNMEFMHAPRTKWHVGDELAGYCRSAGNLTEVLIRNSGHMVPKEKPIWALDMIDRFINKKTFD